MTQADKNFIETCKEILEHGYSSKGTNVRTRWEDGTEANYYSIVGVTNKYDVEKEFPMITLRNNSKTVYRAIDEVLWIWQKKSNRILDLNSHIWDQWARKDGTIGKAYGYQMGKKYEFKTKDGIQKMDQVDFVLYLLKNDPSSRRIMTNIFNHSELKDMALEPCVYGTQWLVKEGKLHLILNQRSQDMLAANGWNTMQYAALQCLFAKVCGLGVGTLTHNIGDCHIYDRHIPLVEKLLVAKPVDCKPKLVINRESDNFYKYKVEDFEIKDYDYNHDIKLGKIPVAE
ncbi:MAG: thymidylate synthase [Clostridia bacterium]|nr:thymidylate synthase [Clostridia bacterium]MBR3325682.1 thymidylate synthase [Clostridia bacterium]MBR3325687.1 thymidylate synthase [Clostridia bacterium]